MGEYIIKASRARFLNDGHDYLGPQRFDSQEITVKASSQEDALERAAKEYGSAEVVKDGKYVADKNGVWTEMYIEKVKL